MAKEPILSAKDVEIQFSLRGRKLMAIRKCSLDLYEGETLAIVGESGSGKSVFTKSFIGMLDANGSIVGGSITYDGVDISKYKTEKEWLGIRGKKIAMVMQDPMTSLNPLKKVGKQIQESIELHQGLKGEEAKKEAIEMLKKVGIPDPERRYNQYPHEFSGGMRQRVMIAMGLIEKPMKLLYTDFSIIIGSVYLFLPLMIVTVAGVMENIDDDMMEAAQSLGASRTEAFMKVIFPMSLPGIIVGGILVFTGTLTAYTTPQLLGGNSNMVMATLIYQRAMSVSDWTGASVIALIMIVVTLVVIKGFNALAARLDRRGEDYA